MQPRKPGKPTDKKLMVDPRPPKLKNTIKVPAVKKPPVKAKDKPFPMPKITPNKPGAKKPTISSSTDDKIYRTMPITEKQLGGIKKMYGIK
jgi:hypothetical protein